MATNGVTTMTVEQIELRKILSQMLADNGVNRETLTAMVKESIDEKVDKAIQRAFNETNIDGLVSNRIQHDITDAVRSAVREKVNRCFANISVTVTPLGSALE